MFVSVRLHRALAVCVLLPLAGRRAIVPRFPQDVAADFAGAKMRKLTTEGVELYYPEQQREKALRLAAAIDRCSATLRAKLVDGPEQPKVLAYLTDSHFNNAYVRSLVLGQEQQMVVASLLELEMFHWFNLGASRVGDVSCHETVHFIHLNDVHGFWKGINKVTGGVFTPQLFSQSWLIEGLATYYEGQLVPGAGRPHSPVWRGLFEAGVASQGGKLGTSFLSPQHREGLPVGSHYLAGMHFVEYLVQQYGEKRLWELIDAQGSSVFSPFGVTLRFDGAFDKTIGGLMEEYEAHLEKTVLPRARPKEQRVIDPQGGYAARLAGSPADGALAMVTADRDDVPRLRVRERDGTVRFDRAFTQILPGRAWIVASPSAVSGMSFTADGAALFLVVTDLDSAGAFDGRLLQFDARTGDLLRKWDHVLGMGGGVTPDGRRYVFVDQSTGTSNLVQLDLETSARQTLTHFTDDAPLGSPVFSPDGERIAFARWTAKGFNLFLRSSGGQVRALTTDGKSNYGPRWLDADHLLFTREGEGGRLQAHRLNLNTGRVEAVSAAPFLALDAVPLGRGELAFLNREGWSWTVDVAPIQAIAPVTPPRPTSGEIMAVQIAPPPLPPTDAGVPAPTAEAIDAGADAGVDAGEPGEVPAAPLVAESAADAGTPAAARDPDEPPAPQPTLQSDEAYSTLEGFFIPRFRIPFVAFTPDINPTTGAITPGVFATLSLSGTDRLGFHSWAFTGQYASLTGDNAQSFAYGNYLLAPWYTLLSLSRVRLNGITDLSATLSSSRTFWTSPVSIGLAAIERREGLSRIRLIGPSVSASYQAVDDTPYGGPRRGLGVEFDGSVYPRGIGSSFDLFDLALTLRTWVPLPISQRHSLELFARGRGVFGAPEPLMRVGGIAAGFGYSLPQEPGDPDPSLAMPPTLSFSEPLRGYEDHGLAAVWVGRAGATYTYPIIIDHGWASFLWIFPSVYVRQLDVQLFGEGAYLAGGFGSGLLGSAGAAVYLRTTWQDVLPVSLYYQVAARFGEGLPALHVVGVSTE